MKFFGNVLFETAVFHVFGFETVLFLCYILRDFTYFVALKEASWASLSPNYH